MRQRELFLGKSITITFLQLRHLTLMPNRKYAVQISREVEPIQREVAASPARNDQFPQSMLDSSANCGMIAQRHKGVDDEVGGFRCARWVGRNQKIRQAVKVAPGAR